MHHQRLARAEAFAYFGEKAGQGQRAEAGLFLQRNAANDRQILLVQHIHPRLRGRPSARSAIMLRWTSLVPAQIVEPCAKR